MKILWRITCDKLLKQKFTHENKSKTFYVTEDLDGNLSFHYLFSFSIWATVVFPAFIPANIHPHHLISAVDDVHRRTVP